MRWKPTEPKEIRRWFSIGKVDGSDLIKYITERVVTYMETPKEHRKEYRINNKGRREHWMQRWFGLLPFSIFMWVQKRFKGK